MSTSIQQPGVVMLWLEKGLYLRVEELPHGPKPLPLCSGFSKQTAYRALGCFNPSETSDAYYILSNDRDEIWFICNRHLRTVCLMGESHAFRIPLNPPGSLSAIEERPLLPAALSDHTALS